MARPSPKSQPQSYADYVSWPDEQRWELIEGTAYDMTPAPSLRHQQILGEVFAALRSHFTDTPCQVLVAPVDVLLPKPGQADEESDTVLQPDLLVVCDPAKMRENFVKGAPDFVVEVLSPATAKKDEGVKRDAYEQAGVDEYWLIHPTDNTVTRYALVGGQYGRPDIFGLGDELVSTRFRGLRILVDNVLGPGAGKPNRHGAES